MQGHFVVWKGLTERWFKLSAYFHTMSGLTINQLIGSLKLYTAE